MNPAYRFGEKIALLYDLGNAAASGYAARELGSQEHRTRNAVLGGLGGFFGGAPVTGGLTGALIGESVADDPEKGRTLGAVVGAGTGLGVSALRNLAGARAIKAQVDAINQQVGQAASMPSPSAEEMEEFARRVREGARNWAPRSPNFQEYPASGGFGPGPGY